MESDRNRDGPDSLSTTPKDPNQESQAVSCLFDVADGCGTIPKEALDKLTVPVYDYSHLGAWTSSEARVVAGNFGVDVTFERVELACNVRVQ